MTVSDQEPLKWLPVLMYHRIVDRVEGPDPHRLKIATADFDAQMAYLKARGYQAIPLDDVPAAVGEKSQLKKPVAITFDDGYVDTYTHALPVLKKHGFTATIMLVSDYIGGRNDWDHGREDSMPLLSTGEIRELAQDGIRFGSHGETHESLPDMSIDDVRSELAGSKAKLEQLLGYEIKALAYPYGRCSPDVCRIAEEVGYRAGFGVDHGSHAMFNFSRIDAASCKGDTLLWRLKVSGVYDTLRQRGSLRRLNNLRKRMANGPTYSLNQPIATSST